LLSYVIELLIATTNPAKFAEIQSFLKNLAVTLRSLQSLGQWPTVIEDGATFEENVLKKARTLAQYSGCLTLADDSGLEVDVLHGAPGIYSARYCGEEGNDDKNNEKLLRELQGIPDQQRTARFVCALALCAPDSPNDKELLIRKSCEGRIALARKGKHGFGYDPIFFFPPFGKTFGEIDRETKATVSHRGKALRKLTEILPSLVDLNAKP
jgi:XTP/dITP diphosphohydrolase